MRTMEQQIETPSVENWIHQWGGSIAEAVLDLNCQYFTIPEIDGFIGYRILHGCVVAIGDPVCARENQAQLSKAFQQFYRENNWPCVYFLASKQFAKWAIDHLCKIMVEVGEEIIF